MNASPEGGEAPQQPAAVDGKETADKFPQTGASPSLSTPPAAPPQAIPFPPVPTTQLPQMAGLMIQAGIGQQQQNPEVIRHITEFLKIDSGNRLSAHESRGRRTHVFRMTALIIGGLLAFLILLIPLVALARGDMPFVTSFLDKYFQQIVIIALALLGGGKLFEIFR